MPLHSEFWQPWSEIDPSLRHGGVEGELGTGWVGPRLGDNLVTKNQDMMMIFNIVRDCSASLSQVPNANVEGPPVRNTLEEILKAWNWISERILDRVTPRANRIFQWTHATPVEDPFKLRPVMFPLRNSMVHECVYYLLGAAVEIAESNANGLHSRLDVQSGARILAPIFHVKANIMRDYFDIEVGGEISTEELELLVGKLEPSSPTTVPPGTTAPRPTAEAVATERVGTDVLNWFPSDEDWVKFSEKVGKMYIPERIFQPEGAMRTTEDVSPEVPVVPTSQGQP